MPIMINVHTKHETSTTLDDAERKGNRKFFHHADVETLSKNQNKFIGDLYMALTKEVCGNILISPFSITAAMFMAHIGTGGNTELEVKNVMNFSTDKKCIQRAFQDLIMDYKQSVPEYQLLTSNMAFISDKLPIIESYVTTIEDTFLSIAKTVNFDNYDAIRQEINEAIEKETMSKIKDIVPPGLLSDLTRMVLVNAIYFKGLWLHPFDSKMTEEKQFWIKSDNFVNVPMMTLKKEFKVANLIDMDAKILAMEYQGERISFVILLPNKRDGLHELEQKMANIDLAKIDMNAVKQEIVITIPKFKLEESLDLVSTFKSMGIKDLFSKSACDLSGISEEKSLFVSSIIHKTFLDVNEEGSEAAAATVMAIMMCRAVIAPPPFVADHPFVFYIKDTASNNILFMGRYTEPVKE